MDKVSCFGTATARYISAIPRPFCFGNDLPPNDSIIDVALGTNVIRWDLENSKSLREVKSHVSSAITALMPSASGHIAIASHQGDISIWNLDLTKTLSSIQTAKKAIMHAAWSADSSRFLATCENEGCSLEEFAVSPQGGIERLRVITKTAVANPDDAVNLYFGDYNQDQEIVAILKDKETYCVVVFDQQNKVKRKSQEQQGRMVSVITTSKNKEYYATSVARMITVFNARTAEIAWEVKTPGSGLIKCFQLIGGDHVLVPTDSGKIHLWSSRGEIIKEYEIGMSSPIFYMEMSSTHTNTDQLWITTESTLISLNYPHDKSRKPSKRTLCLHDLVCCGLDINSKTNLIAAGDFTGNVFLWDPVSQLEANKKSSHSLFPQSRIFVGSSIRSLAWKKDGSLLLIGTLEGHTFMRSVSDTATSHIETVHLIPSHSPDGIAFSLTGSITCLQWQHGGHGNMVAAGTTDGTLAVFEMDSPSQSPQPIFRVKLAIKAHKPSNKEQQLDFGSLHKFAEIWSLCWSPDNDMIATTSEDQTTCIWNLYGECLRVLEGHKLAVTCVDWQRMDSGISLLATCSDDLSIRLYDTTSWEVIGLLTAKEVEEWHTFTYCALQKNGNKLVCSTQNGYIVVWNVKTGNKVFIGKLHAGSIEGLKWEKDSQGKYAQGLIASCSADCCVNAYYLRDENPSKY